MTCVAIERALPSLKLIGPKQLAITYHKQNNFEWSMYVNYLVLHSLILLKHTRTTVYYAASS